MKKLLCAFLACALIFMSGCASDTAAEQMEITILAAGKADAILIDTSQGAVLIDAGLEENKDDLLDLLAEKGIDSLYALIITHFDKDHVGGADWVLNELKVSHVYTSYACKESGDVDSFEAALADAGLTAAVISGTQSFSLGKVTFEINGAAGSYDKDESNNSSLIIKVTFGEKTYLFAGDAENERIMEYIENGDADADFLKVPYHGHSQKKLDELIEAVSPEVSVITDSSEEPDASEIAKTLSLLSEAGSDVYETKNGTVTLICTEEAFTAEQ